MSRYDISAEDEARGLEAVREHRDDLESLAESDLPAAWIAQTLLDAAEKDREEIGDHASSS